MSCRKNTLETKADSLPVVLIVLLMLVGGATIFAHWNALSAEALFLDDNHYLMENRLVLNPSWASVTQFFREVLEPSTIRGYYQPLTMISLMIDHAMGGRVGDLYVFHRTSLGLHVANTILLTILMYMLFRQPWVAAFVGLLFGVHPMTAETITWISERKTLLATFFATCCLIGYVRYVQHQEWKFFAVSLTLYILALLSKPTTTPLPLAMLLLDFWPLRRLDKRACVEKVAFFIVGGVSAVITVISQDHLELAKAQSFSIGQTLLLMCHNIVFYPWHMIWPVGLSSLYEFPKHISMTNSLLLASVIINGVLLIVLVVSLRRTRALLVGWLCYCVLLLPTLLNKNYSPSVAWDKYAYLPALGLLLLLAWLMEWVWSEGNKTSRDKRRAGMGVVVLATVCLLIVGTRRLESHWATSLGLYDYAISRAPNSPVLYFTRSAIHGMEHEYDRAIQDCDKAIALEPNYARAYHNRGVAYDAKGNFAQAVHDFSRAIELNPDYAMAYDSRGNSLFKMHDYERALSDYSKAILLKQDNAMFYCNRARCYRETGDYDNALKDYARAIELRPDYAITYNSRASAYYDLGQYDKAWADVERFCQLGGRPNQNFINKLLEASERSR